MTDPNTMLEFESLVQTLQESRKSYTESVMQIKNKLPQMIWDAVNNHIKGPAGTRPSNLIWVKLTSPASGFSLKNGLNNVLLELKFKDGGQYFMGDDEHIDCDAFSGLMEFLTTINPRVLNICFPAGSTIKIYNKGWIYE